ncbi:uncharacterized protein K02A2.6-like [Saccostrea cucullata]|uniref:uncharacterized protein K02A2.6-like n=1 Tax=Saccostrea cuccullata TaxID=36930 RepID=UPI002ED30706
MDHETTTFKFTVIYTPGSQNAADVLSRQENANNNTPNQEQTSAEDYVNFVIEHAVPKAMTIEEIERVSENDPTLQQVRENITSGTWTKSDKILPFYHIRSELAVRGPIVLKQARMIIPQSLRKRTLEIAHESHQGVVKTKALLREKVWWPKMDEDVETAVLSCHACQMVCKSNQRAPVTMTDLPTGPWKKLGMDLCGPFPTGEQVLVIVDYYTRYPEIEIMKSVTSKAIIRRLVRIFATYGLPEEIVTDNGRQFISDEFENFLARNGIKYHRTLPYWPQANGEVERFNATLKKSAQIAKVERKDWRFEIYKFLLNYRNTPHSTTGESPAKLMFGRELRTRIPQLPQIQRNRILNRRDRRNKIRIKTYADRLLNAKSFKLLAGERVLIRNNMPKSKLDTKWNEPFTVISHEGSAVKIDINGRATYRNINLVRPFNGTR